MSIHELKQGMRVKLARDVEIYPIGIFTKGMAGIVETVDLTQPDVIAHVKLDAYDPELDDWDNCLQVGRPDRPNEFATYPADYEAA